MSTVDQIAPETLVTERHEAVFRVSETLVLYRDRNELLRVLASELRRLFDFGLLCATLYDQASGSHCFEVFQALGFEF